MILNLNLNLKKFLVNIYIFLNLRDKFCLKNRLIVWIAKKKYIKKKLKMKEEKIKIKELNVLKNKK